MAAETLTESGDNDNAARRSLPVIVAAAKFAQVLLTGPLDFV